MKRFTETLKWTDPWFRRLSAEAKMLWYYLLDHCDNIGLVEIDYQMASVDCGLKLESKHLLEFGDRIQNIDGRKLFLPKFIRFQYGRLSSSCPAHKRVIEAIELHGLEEKPLGYLYPSTRVALPKKTGQDKTILEDLWQIFPATSRNRSSRAKFEAAWAKTKDKPSDTEVIEAAKAWASCHEWTKDGGQYAPGAHIWIKDRKWESLPVVVSIQNNSRPLYDEPTFRKNGTSNTRPLFD